MVLDEMVACGLSQMRWQPANYLSDEMVALDLDLGVAKSNLTALSLPSAYSYSLLSFWSV